MEWIPVVLVWLLAIAVVGWVSVAWGPRGRARRRDRKQDGELRALLDQFGDPSPATWPADRLYWRKLYRTAWERTQDEPRMFTLGFEAKSTETDGQTYWEVAWVHRSLDHLVEQAGA